MRVLALDTTIRSGSAALVVDSRVVDERAGDPSRTHGERLPADVTDLLARHGLTIADVDLFAVATGPGSFTGLRIGIATIQGLAFVHERLVVGVSALEALAQLASTRASAGRPLAAAWMDAHRGDVFAALYEVTASEPFTSARLVELDGASVGRPGEILATWRPLTGPRTVTLTGDGAELYRADAESAGVEIVSAPVLAAAIAKMAIDRARAGAATSPGGIQPLYVRRPDAELARDAERRRPISPSPDHVDGMAR
jgi:tRNA threonylcarbamoyladenosine biosynthesis protein TsaB